MLEDGKQDEAELRMKKKKEKQEKQRKQEEKKRSRKKGKSKRVKAATFALSYILKVFLPTLAPSSKTTLVYASRWQARPAPAHIPKQAITRATNDCCLT